MALTSGQRLDFSPEPDLHPLYPTTTYIASLLSPHSGLSMIQRAKLVAHSLSRACAFGELSVLQYLVFDPQAQPHVDLGIRDEDGLGLVSLVIHGFGADSDRDVEREECVRLLIAQGASLGADKAGWTPLHYAALLSPPTLVSHLMTHGCSPFTVTRRNLTPLDVVTAHSILPGRDDVALLLEESMRGEGWTGGRMEQKRRLSEQRMKREERKKEVRDGINKAFNVNPAWWDLDSGSSSSDSGSEDEEGDDRIYTPLPDYSSMLVFSPPSLPHIFDSLITNFQPSLRNSTPANYLYMFTRFACLTCDHTWLEDLMIGATDAIEETFFNRPDDVTCLVFWLFNATILLHLLQCDTSINEVCEMLGSFELIEEVINSVFVFIIRFAERRIDQLLDFCLLNFCPLPSEYETIQFESDWSFLRSFTGKKKSAPPVAASSSSALSRGGAPSSPPSPQRPLSPSQSQGTLSSSTSRGFSSLKQSFSRGRTSSTAPLTSLFPDAPPPPSPKDLISVLTALHTLLTLSNINPAFTAQLWSQVMYWTSCELFNRIITRKKYLCRSRAIQIGMNLAVLEEWIGQMQLPPGVQSHFVPVRNLLNWLQCLSSISEFPELVATIQTMRSINPLQMRRAVRDYKYEVNEGRMTEECIQYITQLQKDWERHRVKLGVEALRKEMSDRDRDHEDSVSSQVDESSSTIVGDVPLSATHAESPGAHHDINLLFGTPQDISIWEPAGPPPALGELLDSRYMLPLLFPSNPRMLAAVSIDTLSGDEELDKQRSARPVPETRSTDSNIGSRQWRLRNKKFREVGVEALRWVDDNQPAVHWVEPFELHPDGQDDKDDPSSDYPNVDTVQSGGSQSQNTPLTRKPSGRSKGRQSLGGTVAQVIDP